MTDQELIAALRRNMAETGSLRCLGCGHEHGCSTHGCAVLRQAAERIERLSAGHSAVRCGDCFWFQDEVCCCSDSDWFADFPPEDCRCKSGKRKEADHAR